MNMNIAILLLLMMTSVLYAEYKMRTFWGRPSSFVSFDDYTSIAVDNNHMCMSHCYATLYCVMSLFENGVCYNYNYNTVLTVEQLDWYSDSYVALKTNGTSSDEMCSVEFVDIFPFNMTIYDPRYPLMSFEYTVSYQTKEISFTYNVTRLCPPGFTKFVRPKGEYCLYVYATLTTLLTYNEAAEICTGTYKGVLSGLETEEERIFVAAQGEVNNLKDTYGANMFWISGNRKNDCSTTAQVAEPACAGINGFTQTDLYLTTLDGYKWSENNPDGVTADGATQSCIIIWTEKNPGTLHGKVDDMTCGANKTQYAAVRGFLCGRVAGV